MSGTKQPEAPKRGEAAWRAAKDAIARRNDEASRAARARREAAAVEQIADRRATERRQRAQFEARRRP